MTLLLQEDLNFETSLPVDVSKDFFQSAQLRADQMFRDAIAEHRAKVKDTDLKNPGHMEAGFR